MDSFKKGQDILRQIDPSSGERIQKMLEDIAPDMARWIIEFPFGEVYSRPGLDLKTRELLTIASLTTQGTAPRQLENHIQNALLVGCSREEIVEAILQMAVYAGFPKALNALFTARDVFSGKAPGQ
ncbi:MAG: carboxymuconolactone decarboxylase family protein [Candidatus Omnitrophota bacterium]|jgi:4-carboxymuconolactone decarboxylase